MTSKGTYKTLKQSKLFEFAQISHASNHIGTSSIKMSLDLTIHENTHVSYTKSMGDKVLKSILSEGHFGFPHKHNKNMNHAVSL